ncbi:MAG: DUF6165 family protein [Pseudomonadota bacterium]
MLIHAPVSWGELLDKITILEIKAERISDPGKSANVAKELAVLCQTRDDAGIDLSPIERLVTNLREVNETLWQIEDDIRECERLDRFDARFVDLARAVYKTNDRRAALKREINDALGSDLVEEKSYASYE